MNRSHSEAAPAHRECAKTTRIPWTIAVVLATALSGCGGRAVPVHGTVERNGTKLSAGRIVLTPVGGGMPAQTEIQNDGTFQVTIERAGAEDAADMYRVQVLETTNTEKGKFYTSYIGPRDKPLEIRPGAVNEFAINIREQDGWQIHEDK